MFREEYFDEEKLFAYHSAIELKCVSDHASRNKIF